MFGPAGSVASPGQLIINPRECFFLPKPFEHRCNIRCGKAASQRSTEGLSYLPHR